MVSHYRYLDVKGYERDRICRWLRLNLRSLLELTGYSRLKRRERSSDGTGNRRSVSIVHFLPAVCCFGGEVVAASFMLPLHLLNVSYEGYPFAE